MKKVILVLIFLFLFLPNANALDLNMNSIYSSSDWINDLSLYDGTIAWSEGDSSLSGIKYWDGSNVVSVPGVEGYRQGSYASLYDGKIAWMASKTSVPNDYDILFWDGNTTSVLAGTNGVRDEFPSVWGGEVAWFERSGGAQINYWDGSVTQKITTSGTNVLPSLGNGEMAWQNDDGVGSNIIYWDGQGTTPITSGSAENLEPILHNGQIAWWQRTSGNTAKILFWNGTEIEEVTDGTFSDAFPSLYDGNIIWERSADIWFWDGLETYQLTEREGGESYYSSDIYGNGLAWVHSSQEGSEIVFGMRPNAIPEPATMALFGIGLIGVARLKRRKA